MNKDRRNRISAITQKLGSIRSEIESLFEEEEEAFENLPMSLQESDQGERTQNAAEMLNQAMLQIDDVDASLAEAHGM